MTKKKKAKPLELNARELLILWRKRKKLTQREMADDVLDCTKDMLSTIERGARLPSLAFASHVERVCGISAASWVDSE